MDVKNKALSIGRPVIAAELYQAAREAGAPLGLDPPHYIRLALRSWLAEDKKLPARWALSSDELAICRGGVRALVRALEEVSRGDDDESEEDHDG